MEDYAEALFIERIKGGQCGNCGAYDGPTHRCPEMTATKASRQSRVAPVEPRGVSVEMPPSPTGAEPRRSATASVRSAASREPSR